MRLFAAIGIVFIVHAIAQQQDTRSVASLTQTRGSAPLAAVVAISDVTTISASVTSLPTFSPSGTLILITGSTNAPTVTVASEATTTPAAGSASGQTDGDRVAVIALGTILGALVAGVAILCAVLLNRRRLRNARNSVGLPQHEVSAASKGKRQPSGSWLGSFRRTRPQIKYPAEPAGQLAPTSSQPLMSESVPRHGQDDLRRTIDMFQYLPRDPHRTQGITPRVDQTPEGVANASRHPTGRTADTAVRDNLQTGGPQTQHPAETSTSNQMTTTSLQTPELLRYLTSAQQRKEFALRNVSGSLYSDPLGSHPITRPAEPSAQDQPLMSEQIGNGAKEERKSSIPRERFADAIAGLGIEPDNVPEDRTVSVPSMVVEPSMSARQSDQRDASDTDHPPVGYLNALQQPPTQPTIPRRRPYVSRLKIPGSLMPGRQKSKRTRFSMPGEDEVSPSESWQDVETAGRSQRRRPSTISPISSDQETRPVHMSPDLQRMDPRGKSKRTGAASSPPKVSGVRSPPLSSRLRTGKNSPGKKTAMVSGVNHVRQDDPDASEVRQHPPVALANRSAAAIRRKPAPFNLASLANKPLPPHPVPTSKYNQAARKTTQEQIAISQEPPSDQTRRYESAEDMSSRLRREQARRVPPTVYEQMVGGMSGMSDDDRGPTKANVQHAARPPSEFIDSNVIISSYMQPRSMEQPQQDDRQQLRRDNRNIQSLPERSRRGTPQFFDDPRNSEHAQVYSSYYSQPSPAQFKSPTISEQSVPMVYTQTQAEFQRTQRQSRAHPPPVRMSLFPRQQLQPYGQSSFDPDTSPSDYRTSQPTTMASPHNPDSANQYSWRDSRQDAWRDSLSKSGSEPASASANGSSNGAGTGGALTTTSSNNGGRTGLWGAPGYFGAGKPSS